MALQFKSFIYGLLAGSGTYALLSWIHKLKKQTPHIDFFLFAPNSGTVNCMEPSSSYCNNEFCVFCNYKKLLALLKNTKKSLDICVYLITSEEITRIIVALFRKGIHVRIIIDKQMSDEAQNSKVYSFVKEYIPLKVVDTGEIMHNKFAIIDRKILVTGSFNWTQQGLFHNYESGLVIHDERIVNKFEVYYQNMWLIPNKT